MASDSTKQVDLVCLGELLIDFVATATGPLRSAPGFVRAAGGAPANVAVAAARLGLKTAFLGAVGRDEFGQFLRATLESNGVDVSGLVHPPRGRTPLAFVSLKENADRDFLFYWHETADHCMGVADLHLGLVRSCRVFHFGSISLIHPSMRAVTQAALAAARDTGEVFITCDPNVRLNLWHSSVEARATILGILTWADLVKLNEEELEFLTGKADLKRGLQALARFTKAAVLVTRGPRGAVYCWGNVEGEVPGFSVAAVDSTGAGDGFMAGFLCRMLETQGELRQLQPDAQTLSEWVLYANAVGALATTKRGAIPAFPTPSEAAALLQGTSHLGLSEPSRGGDTKAG